MSPETCKTHGRRKTYNPKKKQQLGHFVYRKPARNTRLTFLDYKPTNNGGTKRSKGRLRASEKWRCSCLWAPSRPPALQIDSMLWLEVRRNHAKYPASPTRTRSKHEYHPFLLACTQTPIWFPKPEIRTDHFGYAVGMYCFCLAICSKPEHRNMQVCFSHMSNA